MILNPVNCVGVMGGGLARKFKDRMPKEYTEAYEGDCITGKLKPGAPTYWVHPDGQIICNFPTKNHYQDPSRYEWIATGMVNLALDVRDNEKVKTIGLPALGCGLGNLNWDTVKHIVRMGTQLAPEVNWTVWMQ